MTSRDIPNPNAYATQGEWASALFEYLQDQENIEREVTPQVLLPEYQVPGQNYTADPDGLIMYSPQLGYHVTSLGGAWVQVSGGGGGGGPVSWGSLNGLLSDQADLQSALNAKQNVGNYALATHTHVEADITNLGNYIEDAPSDGNTYGRNNGVWLETGGSSVGGGTTITMFQVQDNATGTGQTTTGTMADIAGIWGTPSFLESGFAWDGTAGILTINDPGTVEFDINVMAHQSTGSNRTQIEIELYKNGTTVLVRAFNYSHRNGTQDAGGVTITGFKDNAADGDTYRVRVRDIGIAVNVGSATVVGGATYISAKLYT